MDALLEADELLVLARHDLQKGQIEDGLLKLKRLQQMPAPSAEATLELARLYAQLGLRRRALPLFEAYLDGAPHDIDVRFQLGMALFEEGHRAAALPVWNDVLSVVPHYPPALFYRALALSQDGLADEARMLLQTALDVLPSDNLYFSRSRKLLADLDGGRGAETNVIELSAPNKH